MSEAEFKAIMDRLDDLSKRVDRIALEKGDDDTMLHIRDVVAMTSLSEREIYRRIKDGEFPKSVPMGGTRRAWHKGAIKAWNRKRLKSAS